MTRGPTQPVPLLGTGRVYHRRLRPVVHAFSYQALFLLLPLRALRTRAWPALQRNRAALLGFRDADHGDGGSDCLDWIDDWLQQQGVTDADGEVWLQCLPRVLGHAFKPVSFWYCQRADGSLAAVLAEVRNTVGAHHRYLLRGDDLQWGAEVSIDKHLPVSPFCPPEGRYRLRFYFAGHDTTLRSAVRVAFDDAQGPLLLTGWHGRWQPLTLQGAVWACVRSPLAVLGVWLRIHGQALRLWCKRLPCFALGKRRA